MKSLCIFVAATAVACFGVAAIALAADVNGLWTKTTNPDRDNITIFFQENNGIKAIGYSEHMGKKVIWYAEGVIEGKRLQCRYRYSQQALPPGWEAEGTMNLKLSEDGDIISGIARSGSGNWSDKIAFKRIQTASP
jgi:hypothetical protein